ncbi:hypothetical protein M406DRAFT_357251 [Cryphonectria parasitica EP155]|uniref:Uncharacterized protein n=1 Tax=Cryphonectria parasitica (strain ATCC 38755 / EP155) TaxID=660469 RepID=A0A9P4XYW0_CRYP1|nr:uncharacterized protein M406DRAFT_357251 [Cryphonectria parasitica EP155]KAF3763854.1 hypothetical protein M406DRAFT_357251 [Cryphonectria parasitica EP155]
MMWDLRILTLILGFMTASTLAYPTWWLGAFNFRCKPPGYVETYTNDWNGEWRVSSICAPGTCCSNWASTGPLCTKEACAVAETERVRLTAQHKAAEDNRKKQKQKEEEAKKEEKEKEAEKKWREKEKAAGIEQSL